MVSITVTAFVSGSPGAADWRSVKGGRGRLDAANLCYRVACSGRVAPQKSSPVHR